MIKLNVLNTVSPVVLGKRVSHSWRAHGSVTIEAESIGGTVRLSDGVDTVEIWPTGVAWAQLAPDQPAPQPSPLASPVPRVPTPRKPKGPSREP